MKPHHAGPPAQWRVGDVIADRFEVREVLGSGGIDEVYRVFDPRRNIDKAARALRAQSLSDPASVADFEARTTVWAGVGPHPNLVSCAGMVRVGGQAVVLEEWVDSGTLADAIASGRLYVGDRAEVLNRLLNNAIKVARGLEHVHRQGAVHANVKPGRVLLGGEGTVKVSFGTLLRGAYTPAYCSPEQYAAAQAASAGTAAALLTPATDVWSWAISVWEMFTGGAPVRHGPLAGEAFAAYREDSEGWSDGQIPAIPAPVAALLQRCFDLAPRARPDIGSLVADLMAIHVELVDRPSAQRETNRPRDLSGRLLRGPTQGGPADQGG